MPTPFAFPVPRDARTPVIERLEWLTDLQPSMNGVESRRGLRAFPRQTYSFDVIANTPASKTALFSLRSEMSFLVPLWCHVFERPNTVPDAGISTTSPQVMLLDHKGNYSLVTGPVTWSTGCDLAAPCAPARYTTNSRSFTRVTGLMDSAKVSFRLDAFKEAVAVYGGATSSSLAGVPLLDPYTATGSALSEQIAVDANDWDNGWLDITEARFIKRNYSVSITLNTRAAILQFRQMLFALRGRLNPLRWTAPGDAVEKTWRLNSDAIELSYLRPGLLKCTLTLTELP
jgi:hypothetical protein